MILAGFPYSSSTHWAAVRYPHAIIRNAAADGNATDEHVAETVLCLSDSRPRQFLSISCIAIAMTPMRLDHPALSR